MDARKLTAVTVVAWLSLAAIAAPGVSAADGPADTSSVGLQADAAAEKLVVQPPPEAPESLLGWLHRSLGTCFTLIFLALTLVLVALMVASGLSVPATVSLRLVSSRGRSPDSATSGSAMPANSSAKIDRC